MGTLIELPERIRSKIVHDLQYGCWLWCGQINEQGYGRVRDGKGSAGKTAAAHRFVYELLVGPIPAGLTIDHLCHVRRCVNPEHLDPVTIGENVHRSPRTAASINSAKTHCVNGHEFTEENTGRDQNGHRFCRTCRRTKSLASYHRRRQ